MSAATKRHDLGSVLGGLEPLKAMVQGWVKEAVREERDEAERLQQARRPPKAVEAVEIVYVNRAQAAARTGYSLRTIARRIADGVLPAYGPRADRIKLTDLERMMAGDATEKSQESPAPASASDEEAWAQAEVDRLLNDE